ncbi:MAG: patatin-like phospholipase family protein [Acidobacteria bacterium]|nr:patatin-like phospholipase family protein [Candidatus Sulfomarinibacter sp. MAG AM2]
MAHPKIGIALGAGGAKGVAHIPMLEALDELGITPHRIAGCSIGAVMGALYASGLSAQEIKDKIARLAITRSDTVRGVFSDRKINKWLGMIDPDFRRSGLIKSESIMAELCEDRSCETFEELAIPLTVVATDFWERRTVVLDSGPLKPAIQASMALPGLFTPVELDGRVLIDGGTVNPVPYDVLTNSCDVVIAIDINSGSAAERGSVPGYFDTVFGSVQIMQQAIVEQELRARPPDIYINPQLSDFRTLHYHKVDEIYRQADAAKLELKHRLTERLAI